MTQVVASFAAKAAPGAPLAAVVAIFVASALVVVAVGLTYYVFVERRFMTRDWHLLVWAAIKRALGRKAAPAPVDQRPRLVVSREKAAEASTRRAAANRSPAPGAADACAQAASTTAGGSETSGAARGALAPLRRRQAIEAAAHQEQMAPMAGVDLHALQDLRQQRRP